MLKALRARVFRVLWTAAKGLTALVALTVVAGFAYETIGAWRDARVLPRVGRAVDIGGRTLNIACAGEGSPTVILESGHTSPGYVWVPSHREIAAFTRVCWYDRAGLGWSDPGPDPNWGDSAARDLHALLSNAGVRPPYVMVGHSFGGYIIRLYHEAYPDEVAGMVFVDVAHEDAGTIEGMPHRDRPNVPRWMLRGLAVGLSRIGLMRFVARHDRPRPDGWSDAEWDTLSRLRRRRTAMLADFSEGPEIETASRVRAARAWERLPVTVLSQGRMPEGDSEGARHWRSVLTQWIELQRTLSQRSARGRFIVTSASHAIPIEDPAAVVSAVRDLVSDLRTP